MGIDNDMKYNDKDVAELCRRFVDTSEKYFNYKLGDGEFSILLEALCLYVAGLAETRIKEKYHEDFIVSFGTEIGRILTAGKTEGQSTTAPKDSQEYKE